ncbi:DUF2534 family protein [Candidatus Erwinia dacicola]|uniref:DUF2534 domain-containing protein n=1 Tax=Candidatus Erwinia dacicola TaxID=252393 RepID=A0A1E7Z455_9GAMM|nr:DUF2534 family protein [Candidatus Erwinia dacicola]NJC99279.1 DUF2534 family protein [Candidatus Erwinia dacicola]OFC63570.1 hypothetical protein BBW68_04805 [Candidatus Erwinia dacicola]RAP71040.1 hypothetical protein ACZ87_02152 [Candidatus Erwinia dacicola]
MSLFPPGKKRRHFFTAQACVLVCAIIVMTKAMIGGAINEYNMPFSTWPVELYVSEFFMITIYSVVFTLLLSVPLWYWFIGEQDPSGK